MERLEAYSNIAAVSTVAKICNIIVRSDEGITRAELARFTGFSKSTITQHVDTLLSSGFITQISLPDKSNGGRTSQYLKLNKDCGVVVAIDLGITSLHVGICNIMGEPLAVKCIENINVNEGPEAILQKAVSMANDLLEELNVPKRRLLGVGMGVPAPLEFSTGRPVSPPVMLSWDGYSVKEYLEKAFGVRAYVDNDVNIMAIAELWRGDARDDLNFLFIKLGTGIGCGIISNGNIYRGSNGCAGDIGHMKVDGFTHTCYCGNIGCLEKLAGAAAIQERAYELARNKESPYLEKLLSQGEEITCKSVNAAVTSGDISCIELIRTVGGYIGDVVSNLVTFFNPSKIVFGGGISNFGDVIINPIRKKIYGSCGSLATKDLQIQRSRLGENCGVIGAAILVREELFHPKEFTKVLSSVLEEDTAANGK